MKERLPSQPENEFERQVLEEKERLRNKRDELLKSPITEESLQKMAERNVKLRIEDEKRKREMEKEKRHISAEGLTEEELEKIAKKRIGK